MYLVVFFFIFADKTGLQSFHFEVCSRCLLCLEALHLYVIHKYIFLFLLLNLNLSTQTTVQKVFYNECNFRKSGFFFVGILKYTVCEWQLDGSADLRIRKEARRCICVQNKVAWFLNKASSSCKLQRRKRGDRSPLRNTT